MTTFDARSGGYRYVPPQDYAWQKRQMRAAQSRDKRLKLFSLDYWDPLDKPGIQKIAAEERANGFIPCVSTPDLTRIVSLK